MDYSRFSLRLVIKLIIMLGLGMFSFQSVLADIPLNSLNRLGSDGAYYWIIRVPGTYYLDIPESSLLLQVRLLYGLRQAMSLWMGEEK